MKRNLSRAPWFWGAVHNLIAHPLLVTRARWATAFHNWTAERMDKEPAGQDRLAVVSGQLRPMGGVPPAPAPIDPNFTVVAELRRLQSIGDQANRHLARIVAAVEASPLANVS